MEPAIGTRSEAFKLPARPWTQLRSSEIYWYNRRDWLKAKGYVLRARYQEAWTPSWPEDTPFHKRYEDAQIHPRVGPVMDATRTSDGAFVLMKRINKMVHPFEVDIATWLSAEPQRSDPENHCVPIYEVLQMPDDPNVQIIVMPLLTEYDKPHFDTIGEAVSFFRQTFEGVRYLHRQNIAHRDCTNLNIMMDASPIVTAPFHPVQTWMKRDYTGKLRTLSRTQHPVKYYLTDFGLSVKYRPEDRPPLETPVLGADKSVPEFQTASRDDEPLDGDPFPVDVYYLGNLIRLFFTKGHDFHRRRPGFEFLEPLAADMVNADPALRPSMDEVVERFEEIVRGLSSWKLRSRAAKKPEHFGFIRNISHWIRRIQLIVGRYPPIPMP
ncbi:kinase-like domain-containing protein [Mycena maculata]|uniref:Kinase-like domain-containing protein n=1 Tax=Mycena maculata TaxID=230809 RepID=A0AAD7P097_9AGAR|nr:kinase-like domain-containing protein [Mycena maculata]